MSKLTIHGVTQSRAIRTIWMANELGLDFDQEQIAFADGGTRSEGFLKANPAGHIPAITDGDFSMAESCAINIYLAKKHGKLMPEGLEAEAKVLEWSFWVMTDVEKPLLNYLFNKVILPEDQRSADVATQAVADLAWPLSVLDQHLANRDWVVGDAFSVADLNIAGVLIWAKFSRLDLSRTPNVAKWLNTCLSRPALPGR